MASEYYAACNDCGHQRSMSIGGLWRSTQTVCDDCGKIDSIPNQVLEDAPDIVDEHYLIWLMEPEQRKRWARGGRGFEPEEKKSLDRLTHDCACGGYRRRHYEEGVKYRCEKCRSDQLTLTPTGWRSD